MLNTQGISLEKLGERGLEAIRVENEFCRALVSYQGGQVLEFELKQTQGTKPLLWLSNLNTYQPNKAIRGGIPLCFPWFGAHAEHKEYPAHGFARNLKCQCISIDVNDAGHQLVFELKDTLETRKFWDFTFCLQMKISCGKDLQLELSLQNLDANPMTFGFAWHSYFPTQINTTEIEGLEDATYIDQLRQNQQFIQTEKSITFNSETDRIYPITQGRFVLKQDAENQLHIESNAQSAVVWNPWVEKTSKLSDVDNMAWKNFVCIESGQVASQHIDLASGERVQYKLRLYSA